MPAKKPDDFCESCGQYIGPYPHPLSKVLVRGLRKMYLTSGTSFGKRPKGDLALTDSEYGNLPKLQYWLVMERLWRPELNSFARGWWRVTEYGEQFLQGRVSLFQKAITVLNEFQRYEGRRVYLDEIDTVCWTWEDYVRERGTG